MLLLALALCAATGDLIADPAPLVSSPPPVIYQLTVPMPCQRPHVDDPELQRLRAEVSTLRAKLAASKPVVASAPLTAPTAPVIVPSRPSAVVSPVRVDRFPRL